MNTVIAASCAKSAGIGMLAFGVGPTEIIVVGIVVLLLFGSRLPSVMRSLGSSVVEFKKGLNSGSEDDAAS